VSSKENPGAGQGFKITRSARKKKSTSRNQKKKIIIRNHANEGNPVPPNRPREGKSVQKKRIGEKGDEKTPFGARTNGKAVRPSAVNLKQTRRGGK